MNYKIIAKYFSQKNYSLFIGGPIAAVGIIMLIIGWWWMIAAGIGVIGLAIIIVGTEGMVKSDDVDREVAKVVGTYEDKTIEAHGLDKNTASVITFFEYAYDGQTSATMKKGSDGKFRPKSCTVTCLFTTGKCLVIDKKLFSIIDENETESSSVYPLSELSRLEITDRSIEDEGGVLVRYHALIIKGEDGTQLNDALIPQNSVLYDKIEDINHEIKAARKNK